MDRQTSRGEATVTELCALFGVSRQAFYAASKREADDDSPPTAKRARPERRGAWATRVELEAAVKAKAAEWPAWGVRKIWAAIRRDKVLASHKRVWAVMHDLGLVLPPVSEREHPGRRGHVAVPNSNRRWATDLTTAWTRQDGWVAIVPVVDCGDRVALAIDASKSQTAPSVLKPLEGAFCAVFGAPEDVPAGLELRTDNGPQFTGADCERLCGRWRVEQTFSPPGRPTGNAVAERLIQTLKLELIWTRDWESLAELREALQEWRRRYNECRPHQALSWRTPSEQRALNLSGEPSTAKAAA